MKKKFKSPHHAHNMRKKSKQKQKIIIIAVVALVLIVGIKIGLGWGKAKTAPGDRPEKNTLTISNSQETWIGEYEVTRVIDGDTIEIAGGEKVRYLGVDTPELANAEKSAECFAAEAAAKNKELVAGKTVRLEKDTTERDRYNRLLRYVFVGETFVNVELVAQGFGDIQVFPTDIKYLNFFREAQGQAKKAARGHWTACPSRAIKSKTQ